MTGPDRESFGEETPEADAAEQRTPVSEDDDDTWRDAGRVTAHELDANEADLIEQAIAVPEDDIDFDR